jgi:hypothetical protein
MAACVCGWVSNVIHTKRIVSISAFQVYYDDDSADQSHFRMWHLLRTGQNINQSLWSFEWIDMCTKQLFNQPINGMLMFLQEKFSRCLSTPMVLIITVGWPLTSSSEVKCRTWDHSDQFTWLHTRRNTSRLDLVGCRHWHCYCCHR